jgi:hypothetical protein
MKRSQLSASQSFKCYSVVCKTLQSYVLFCCGWLCVFVFVFVCYCSLRVLIPFCFKGKVKKIDKSEEILVFDLLPSLKLLQSHSNTEIAANARTLYIKIITRDKSWLKTGPLSSNFHSLYCFIWMFWFVINHVRHRFF